MSKRREVSHPPPAESWYTTKGEVVSAFPCAVCSRSFLGSDMSNWGGRFICDSCHPQPGRKDTPSPDKAADRHATPATAVQASDKPSLPELPVIARSKRLRKKVLCPHCWHTFPPECAVWISSHANLKNDPVVGKGAPLRFLPSRLTAEGDALDAFGMPCRGLACPRCHLAIPRSLIELRPMVLSIVGTQTAGKSHFLAALTWTLRHILPEAFGVGFTDADPHTNQCLSDYEAALFLQEDKDRLVTVDKTPMSGDLYDQICLAGQPVTLLKPFLFTLQHLTKPRVKPRPRGSVVYLYDNAGEQFQPAMDLPNAPTTRHLAKSAATIFVYDPTQHPRFCEQCRMIGDAPQLEEGQFHRQELVLTEMASRIRKYSGLHSGKQYRKPLIVVVSKSDLWGSMLDMPNELASEPLTFNGTRAALDLPTVRKISEATRRLLRRFSPEFVSVAEAFSNDVVFIPVSSLGHPPTRDPQTGTLGVRAADISPRWVSVPVLYALTRIAPSLIRTRTVEGRPENDTESLPHLSGEVATSTDLVRAFAKSTYVSRFRGETLED